MHGFAFDIPIPRFMKSNCIYLFAILKRWPRAYWVTRSNISDKPTSILVIMFVNPLQRLILVFRSKVQLLLSKVKKRE
jgi:hypothetical protein